MLTIIVILFLFLPFLLFLSYLFLLHSFTFLLSFPLKIISQSVVLGSSDTLFRLLSLCVPLIIIIDIIIIIIIIVCLKEDWKGRK